MHQQRLLSLAIEACLKAGEAIMEIYNSNDFGIELKGDKSPLTKADLAADKIILQYLCTSNIPILSEEGKDIPYSERKEWSQMWIIDPIDGTKEFIKKNGEFTVNIALIVEQKPALGVVYAPALDELYFSSSEIGSYQFDSKLETSKFDLDKLITLSKMLPYRHASKVFTIVASRSHMSPETEAFVEEMRTKHDEVQLISRGSSLKLCMVASGRANCYPRFAPTMEWDTAAGHAICVHAGFDVMDMKTKESMRFNKEHLLNNWFLVN